MKLCYILYVCVNILTCLFGINNLISFLLCLFVVKLFYIVSLLDYVKTYFLVSIHIKIMVGFFILVHNILFFTFILIEYNNPTFRVHNIYKSIYNKKLMKNS